MRIICYFLCVFLLPSCVYYGVQRDFDVGDKSINKSNACETGSKKAKEKCRADLIKLKKLIEPSSRN
jgi:hypothetical protein